MVVKKILLGLPFLFISLVAEPVRDNRPPHLPDGTVIDGFLSLRRGFIASPESRITFDTDGVLSGQILLEGPGLLSLILVNDLRLGSRFEPLCPLAINSKGYTLSLGGPLVFNDYAALISSGDLVINGANHELISENAITIGDDSECTLRNMIITVNEEQFLFYATNIGNSILVLDNVTVNVDGVKEIMRHGGMVYIKNNVYFNGYSDAKMIFPPESKLVILPHSTLFIQDGILSFEGDMVEDDQVMFVDETSAISFNQAGVEFAGDAYLSKGKIICENELTIRMPEERVLYLGDGIHEKNNFTLAVAGGTTLKLEGAQLVDRTVEAIK